MANQVKKEFASTKLRSSIKNSSMGGSKNASANNHQSALNKSESIFVQREIDSFVFIDHTTVAYKFKGNKPVERGQYRLPFVMKLPQKLPGTFTLNKKSNLPNNQHPEDLKIAYHFDCYIEGLKYEMYHSKEIKIK
jgi:hypothetical protein